MEQKLNREVPKWFKGPGSGSGVHRGHELEELRRFKSYPSYFKENKWKLK